MDLEPVDDNRLVSGHRTAQNVLENSGRNSPVVGEWDVRLLLNTAQPRHIDGWRLNEWQAKPNRSFVLCQPQKLALSAGNHDPAKKADRNGDP